MKQNGGATSLLSFTKSKPKRIEKELLLLRNLPKEYKLGKRETALGTLLYVRIKIIMTFFKLVRNG